MSAQKYTFADVGDLVCRATVGDYSAVGNL
jgi:hypothetical protein